jgi:hypothetical protein
MQMSAAHAGSISRAVSAFPDFPSPPQGEIQWVARSMRMNGLPMTIQTIVSRNTPSEVIHFFESWASGETGVKTRRWHTRESEVLSIRARSYLATIELEHVVNGTQGTIVTSSPPEKATLNTSTEFPHPSSWRIANLQQYEDYGKETEHITYTCGHSLVSEAQAMIGVFASSGWTLINKSSASADEVTLEAQRNAQLAQVVITSDKTHRANAVATVLWSKG